MFEISYKTENNIYTDIIGGDELDKSSPIIKEVVSVRCLEIDNLW